MSDILRKSFLDKLHLSKGLSCNSVESLSIRLNGLSKLNTSDLKKYLYIYEFILTELRYYIDNYVNSSNGTKDLNSNVNRLLNDKLVLGYLSNRMVEKDLSKYVDFDFYSPLLREIQVDLNTNYDLKEKLDIYIKCSNLIVFIEYFLLLRDEYWYPRNLFVLVYLSKIGFKFETRKERIWQPKNS